MDSSDLPKERIVNFSPANDKQRRFLYSTKTHLLLSGAVAAGKSLCGCWKGFMINMKYPGARGLICRKEGTSLPGSTLRTLFEQVIPPELIVSHNQQKGIIVHRTPDNKINSTIVYSGLDKRADQSYPTKVGSTEYTWVFGDEITEFQEGDYQMLSTRIRYKLPHLNQKQNDMIPRQIFGATNPDAPTHFLYKFFFGNKSDDREVILTTPYDNPHLPKEYMDKLEGALSGVTRERLLYGKWVQAEGVIYVDFDMCKHVNNEGFLHYSDYKTHIIGADSNYPLPRAAVWVGMRGDGRADVLGEFYQKGAHVEQLMNWINDIRENTGRMVTVYHDPSDPDAISKINTISGVVCNKAHNKVLPGISTVSRYFKEDLIRIDPSCVNLIQEINSYRWKPNKDKEEPEKKEDHAVDGLRYSLSSYNPEEGKITVWQDTSGRIF
jgi:PBSX family phage terminase large subunit